MKKIVDTLREMQYKRLRTTRRLRDMQRTARLPGIEMMQHFMERDANTFLNMLLPKRKEINDEKDC